MDREKLLATPFGPAIQLALTRRDELRRKVEGYTANFRANPTNTNKRRVLAMAMDQLKKVEIQLKNAVALALLKIKQNEKRASARNQGSNEVEQLLREQRRVEEVMARPLGPQPTSEEMANALRGVMELEEPEAAGAGPAAAGAGAEPLPEVRQRAAPVPGSAAAYAYEAPQEEKPKECKPGSTGYGCKCRRGNVGCSIMGGKLRRHRRRSLRKTRSHGHKRSLRRHLTRRR